MKFLILAGGSGTRLWPLSTDDKPKQFHSFISERSLLQMAFDRLSFVDEADIFVSTNEKYFEVIKDQLPSLPLENIIAEPARRDTAPCISFAMKYIQAKGSEDDVVTIINADQLIVDEAEFRDVVKVAQKKADIDEKMVLVSVKTKSANPNLGYIKIKDLVEKDGEVEVYELDKFVEKPDVVTAEKFHNSFKYLWNTAIFTWKIKVFLNELEKNSPDVYKVLEKIEDFSNCRSQYESFPKISIDFALMEKVDTEKVLVIPADLGWSDIGTWETLYDELKKDEDGNVVQGKFKYSRVRNSLLINKTDDEVLLIDMENMVVVNTSERILMAPINDSKALKDLLNS